MTGPLGSAGRAELDRLIAEVTADPARISVLFPAVARRVARGPADPGDPDGLLVPPLEDLARVALLVAAARSPLLPAGRLADEVTALYRYGDADEKRAVLRALGELGAPDGPAVPDPAPDGLALVEDALRTNDSRLIAAAMGRYAARHLPAPAWRQGVLKCLFTGVPLDAVADWERRADAVLARMIADYAAERTSAGRPVPADARRILDLFPPEDRCASSTPTST